MSGFPSEIEGLVICLHMESCTSHTLSKNQRRPVAMEAVNVILASHEASRKWHQIGVEGEEIGSEVLGISCCPSSN